MKIKNILVLFVIGLAIFSCKKDDDDSDNYDAAGQSIIDDSVLIDYLKTHYLNEVDGGIWTITNGETPLMGQVNTQNIIFNDVAYKLYYLRQNEGSSIAPSAVDSIYATYTGMLLDSTVFDTKTTFSWNIGSSPAILSGLIPGWQYGFTNFKGGKSFSSNLMLLSIYSPYVFYYEGQWYKSGVILVPMTNMDFKLTDKFKWSISFSGAYQVNAEVLNYQVMTGTKMLL